MKFSEDIQSTYNNITQYGEGFVQVKDKIVNTSVVLSAEELIADWQPETFEDLTAEHCKLLFESKPDVVILGTGKQQRFPEKEILRFFAQHQVGIEVMDTAAACRTFNVLLSEDRNIVAGLFMI